MKRENNKQKGITLIALIITIIIMIILISVTISISLNGGLFNTAKTASEEMQKQSIKEKAESIVVSIITENMYDNEDHDIWVNIINRVSQEFEGSKINGNIITTNDDKYDIRINEDYSIEVDKKGVLQDTYVPDDLINFNFINVSGNTSYKNIYIEFEIKDEIIAYEYVVSRKSYSTDEKWNAVKELYYNEIDTGKDYNNYEEAITDTLIDEINNYEFIVTTTGILRRKKRSNPYTYTSIEECLQDTSVIALNIKTKEKLYYLYHCYLAGANYSTDESKTNSLEDLLNFDYACYLYEETDDILNEIKMIEIMPDGSKNEIALASYGNLFFTDDSHLLTINGQYKCIILLQDIAIGSCNVEVSGIIENLLSSNAKLGDYVVYNAEAIDVTTGKPYSITKTSNGENKTYTANNNIKWRIIKIDGTTVTLTSELPIYDDNQEEYYLKISPRDNFVTSNSVDEYQKNLDEIASIYGHGNGAKEARSIKYSDINSENIDVLYYNPNDSSKAVSFLLNNSSIIYNSRRK